MTEQRQLTPIGPLVTGILTGDVLTLVNRLELNAAARERNRIRGIILAEPAETVDELRARLLVRTRPTIEDRPTSSTPSAPATEAVET